MIVVANVEKLQVCGGVVERFHLRLGARLVACLLAKLRGEIATVMRLQFTAGAGHRLVVCFVVGEDGGEGGLELLAGVDRHAILGEHAEFVVQGLKIAFHRLGGDRTDGLQLTECLGCQRSGRRAVGGDTHQGQRNQGDAEQREKQFVAKQGSPAARCGRWPVVRGR